MKLSILKFIEFVLFYIMVFLGGALLWTLLLPVTDHLEIQHYFTMNVATIWMGYLIGYRAGFRKKHDAY
jgi:hypothetical protein